MRVAILQLASGTDSEANRRLVDARLGDLPDSVDLVVLPEASAYDFGSADHDLGAGAEPLDGPFADLLARHARRLDATIVAGIFERTTPAVDAAADGQAQRPFNTLLVVTPDGSLAATYRKIHLYDSFGYRESDRLVAGSEPVTITVAGTVLGLQTCYDLRFPELSRALVDAGAQVLVVPAAWVAGDLKLDHWRTLTAARAIENTVSVVAAAQGGDRYTGHSRVVDPLGRVLAEAGEGIDDVLVVDLDPAVLEESRRTNPSLANRRPDVLDTASLATASSGAAR